MPAMIVGRVYVRRLGGAGGVFVVVITDGEQNVGYFLNADWLSANEFVPIHVGGSFAIAGKGTPPIAVVQLGGPGFESSVILDNLELFVSE